MHGQELSIQCQGAVQVQHQMREPEPFPTGDVYLEQRIPSSTWDGALTSPQQGPTPPLPRFYSRLALSGSVVLVEHPYGYHCSARTGRERPKRRNHRPVR